MRHGHAHNHGHAADRDEHSHAHSYRHVDNYPYGYSDIHADCHRYSAYSN